MIQDERGYKSKLVFKEGKILTIEIVEGDTISIRTGAHYKILENKWVIYK